MRTENVACLLVVQAPRRYKNVLRILLVKNNVVENVIVARSQMREARPVAAAIVGSENGPGVGAEEDVVGVLRIISQAAYVAAIRPQNRPLSCPRRGAEHYHNH